MPAAQAAARRLHRLRHLQRVGTRRGRAHRGTRLSSGASCCQGSTGPPPTRAAVRRSAWSRSRPARRALTHRSYAYENGGLPHQRAAGVPRRLGARPGGDRGALPAASGPARGPAGQAARRGRQHARARRGGRASLGLGEYLRLGRGEEATGGRDKASILADTLEALLGAVYLERGLEPARAVIHQLFDPLLATRPRARRRPGLEDLACRS